ncbi:MAG: YbaB/EbfC family nucleoid-associated protein [Pseudomonadota bacterium]
MKNLGDIMKQAAGLQQKMQDLQQELERLEVEGQSGGGMVKVTLTGKGRAVRVAIENDLLNPEEGEVLEDLLVAALNDAKDKAEAKAAEEMKALTEGLPLPPGMNLPF